MYKVTKTGYVIRGFPPCCLIEKAVPITYKSRKWKIWRAIITPGTCYYCASMSGRILSIDDPKIAEIPVHENCKCYVEAMSAIVAGTATNAGADGVDLYVALHGTLPEHYISEAEAEAQGWKKWLGNLAEVLPGRMIGGKIYRNRNQQHIRVFRNPYQRRGRNRFPNRVRKGLRQSPRSYPLCRGELFYREQRQPLLSKFQLPHHHPHKQKPKGGRWGVLFPRL